jgi:hypothetical protein
MTTEEDIDMSSDEALISALTPKQLGELELEPFSLMRQVIASDLRRSGESHFFNAIVTVWVCTLSAREALKAYADIPQAQIDAFAWAEGQGYSLLNYEPLLDAYKRLNEELAASTKARVRGAEDRQTPKNDGGRPL